MKNNRINEIVFWTIIFVFMSYIMFAIGQISGMNSEKEFKIKRFNLEVDRCIRDEIVFYGDLIGEDPDQSARNILKQGGNAIKECLRDKL